MGCTMIVRRVPDRALSERINQMPFLIIAIIAVFIAGRMVGLTPAYLRTSGPLHQARAASESNRPPQRIGGLLAVYVVVLVIGFLHGLGLTVASVIINANPSHAGLSAPLPWGHIAFYLVSNVILAAYAVVLVRLIVKKRKSAIAHNAVYGILTIIFLAAWHFLGMKSLTGTVVDSLPGVVGILYFALSARVKETLAGRVDGDGRGEQSGGAFVPRLRDEVGGVKADGGAAGG
jgi:hypothetical protein